MATTVSDIQTILNAACVWAVLRAIEWADAETRARRAEAWAALETACGGHKAIQDQAVAAALALRRLQTLVEREQRHD